MDKIHARTKSRRNGGIQFLMVRDSAGVIKCTLKRRSVNKEPLNNTESLPLVSIIKLKGIAHGI